MASFQGEARAPEPMRLPDGMGTVSLNQKPGRGDLRAWRAPLEVFTVPAGTKSLWRMGRDIASDTQYWLAWSKVVHAARGFDVEDTTERTYYSGDTFPKVTDNLGLSPASPTPNPVAWRPLGVPAPDAPLSLVGPGASAADDGAEGAFYVYTYVTDWGWESAPSTPSAMVVRIPGGVTQLTVNAPVPAGAFNINRMRLYRTQSGSGDVTEFFFLREYGIGAATMTDDSRMLGEVLPTRGWLPAPGVQRGGGGNFTEPALTNLTPLWNGMLAGIAGAGVRFCVAYTPYAWPISNDAVPANGTPVALGTFGQNLVVLTTGRPVLVSGSTPESMDQAPVEMSQGCIAPRSVVSMGAGVAWASNDGLCWLGSGGPKMLTAGLFTREQWLDLRPETIVGQMYEGLYFGSYQEAVGGPRKGFLIDPGGGGGVMFLSEGFDAAYFDELQDQLYLLRANKILKWEAGGAGAPAVFKSKVYRQPRPSTLAWAQVVADAYPVGFKLYRDGGVLHHQAQVPSANPFRLPPGRSESWQMEVSTAPAADAGVQIVIAASSTEELAAL